jgi:hypothetical protein
VLGKKPLILQPHEWEKEKVTHMYATLKPVKVISRRGVGEKGE